MRAEDIADRFDRLPAGAQRLIAELIEQLSRPGGGVSSWEEATAPERPTAAVLLPAPDADEMPTSWPQNRFMDPAFYGAWANRDDITDSTEYVRRLRLDQWRGE
ncbi:MAG TPA: hypothetical protein VF598_05135 [Hymenobacter sp.]|jgi:hypothetical protein